MKINRRNFVKAGAGLAVAGAPSLFAAPAPVTLPSAHKKWLKSRRRRIVVQHDVYWVYLRYLKMHPEGNVPFGPFRDAVFSYVDEPGSQIDAIWWDIAGNAVGSVYPSKVFQPEIHPLAKRWHEEGIDWVLELMKESRKRKLELFWNHRISEVDMLPQGGHAKVPSPLKLEHPDWTIKVSWWDKPMWNLAAEGLRCHKVEILRELIQRFDLDGIQIDYARHIPCLPAGRQWELRGHVTEFMRMVRMMTLEEAARRGRPVLMAARVPQTLEGCRADGFDLKSWAELNLVDVLTLGSRTMDVDVEGIRAAVGPDIQLQPCFDDHHATDGYRYAPIEFLRGVFANHFQRGANSVVTFNWAMGTPEVAEKVGGEIAPLTHQQAYKSVGDLRTMAGKDKFFAVERRGGYPWADGFFNRNDTAPLPKKLTRGGKPAKVVLHISDAPLPLGGEAVGRVPSPGELTLRCILFGAEKSDEFDIRFNGEVLSVSVRDAEWKDPQIFSPKPQPPSGGKGNYKINSKQKLLRIDCNVPLKAWRQGENRVEISIRSSNGNLSSPVQLEKVEAHLDYKGRGY